MAESSRWSERDADHVARFLGGDPAGFEALVRAHGKALFNFIRRFLGDPEAARDVFQETLLAVIRSIDRFDPKRPFLPWVLGIAVNRCREEKRRRKTLSLEGVMPEADLRASTASPDRRAADRELAAKVARAVSKLDDAHRTVFLLRIYEGFTYVQIGEILNISEGTAKSRMHYALYNVRKTLRAPKREG